MKAKELAQMLLEHPELEVYMQNYEEDVGTYIHQPEAVYVDEKDRLTIHCDQSFVNMYGFNKPLVTKRDKEYKTVNVNYPHVEGEVYSDVDPQLKFIPINKPIASEVNQE